jgi:dTDP-glucose 4,6-dehydratase
VRDWLHVGDHCEAITLALARGRPGEVYNIGGDSETTNIEVVRTLCALADELLGKSPALCAAFPLAPVSKGGRGLDLITHVRDRLGHDRRYAIDYRKAHRDLGYSPSRGLAQGLRETLEWYLDNRAWWEALMGRNYTQWLELNYEGRQKSRTL